MATNNARAVPPSGLHTVICEKVYQEQMAVRREKNPEKYHLKSVDFLKKIVLEEFGITEEQLRVKSRKRKLVKARYMMINVLYKYTELSEQKIAESVGRRDHSTTDHARKRMFDDFVVDPAYKKKWERIINRISGIDVGKEETVGEQEESFARRKWSKPKKAQIVPVIPVVIKVAEVPKEAIPDTQIHNDYYSYNREKSELG